MTKFLSEVRQFVDPSLVWIHDKEMSPKDNMWAEGMSDIAWWIRAGGITIRTDRDEWKIRPGDWVFLRPTRRQQTFLPGTRMVSISYRLRRIDGTPSRDGPDILVLRRCPELEQATTQLIQQVEQSAGSPIGRVFDFYCSPESWLRIYASFLQWTATLISMLSTHGISLTAHSQADERVIRVRSLIERDPWGPSSDLKPLTDAIGLSRRRLEQLFTASFGRGIAEERTRCRIDQARTLLGQRDLPLKAVAKRFGFSTSPAFSAWFRRHSGVSPRAYRNGRHLEE